MPPSRFIAMDLPAVLRLGSNRAVQHENVGWFGTQLRSVVRPGGLIEVLTCNIAAQANMHLLPFIAPATIYGYEPNYHDVLIREFQKLNVPNGIPANKFDQHLFREWTRVQRIPSLSQSRDAAGKNSAFQQSFPERNYPDDWSNAQHAVPPESDGLAFCRNLARSSGAVVRGGIILQVEEGRGISSSISPIGNWEGPVFDFLPDNSVRYHGLSRIRPESWESAARSRIARWRNQLASTT